MNQLKPYNSKAIVNNIELVFKTGDIQKLNNPSYKFIYLLSGFIAHYNLNGFQSAYSDLRVFAQDLLYGCSEEEERRSVDGWGIDRYGKEYCQSEADAIRGIREVVIKYKDKVTQESENVDERKLSNLRDVLNEILEKKDPVLMQKAVYQLGL